MARVTISRFDTPVWGLANGRPRPYSVATARIEEVFAGDHNTPSIDIISLGAVYIHELLGKACWNAGSSADDPWRIYFSPGDELVVWLSRHRLAGTSEAKLLPEDWSTNWFVSAARFLERDSDGAVIGLSAFADIELFPEATDSLRATGKSPATTYKVRKRSTGQRLSEFTASLVSQALSARTAKRGGGLAANPKRVRIIEGRSGELYVKKPSGEHSLVVPPGAVVEATVEAFLSPHRQARSHAPGHDVIDDLYSEVHVTITKLICGDAPRAVRLYSPIVLETQNGHVEMSGFPGSPLRALVPGMHALLAVRPPTAVESTVTGNELWRMVGAPWIVVPDGAGAGKDAVVAQYELTEKGLDSILEEGTSAHPARTGVHFAPTGELIDKGAALEVLVREYAERESTYAEYLKLQGEGSRKP